jgi:hypothetical protein
MDKWIKSNIEGLNQNTYNLRVEMRENNCLRVSMKQKTYNSGGFTKDKATIWHV